MKEGIALITGASSGIGLELARQFAMNGHPLVLVARVENERRTIAEELSQKHNVGVDFIAKDLSDPESASQIWEELKQSRTDIEFLVNNAGLGQRGKFWETPMERDIEMLRVNIGAVVRLTKLFLPSMVARNHGRILNTASIAGFEPGPLLAVYHATKAFVLSFSEAIATELEDTDVTMTALCPGATDTDFFPKAQMIETRAFQKSAVMTPQEVAEAGYKAMMRGERVFVPGAMNKTIVFTRRILSEHAQSKVNEKFYEDVDPEDIKHQRGDYEKKDK